jgi:hypothetical protein
VAALVVSIVGSPWVVRPLLLAIHRLYPPPSLIAVGVSVRLLCAATVVVVVLPIVAIVRIALSRGTRTGIRLALIGLAITVLSWALVLGLWFVHLRIPAIGPMN